MRLERSFGSYFPETHSSETRESIMNTTELEPFVPSGEVVLFSRIGEEPRSEKNKAGGSLENHPEKVQDLKRQSDWESFLSKPAPQQRFINLYCGPFGQQMELNRKKLIADLPNYLSQFNPKLSIIKSNVYFLS